MSTTATPHAQADSVPASQISTDMIPVSARQQAPSPGSASLAGSGRVATARSNTVTRSLNRLAARQHGLLTRAQAQQAGLSARAIDRRIASERWDLIRPGVFAVGGVPCTWEQAILAVCLAGGSGTVVSHETSAQLWGLIRVPAAVGIHVSSPPERRIRLDGVDPAG